MNNKKLPAWEFFIIHILPHKKIRPDFRLGLRNKISEKLEKLKTNHLTYIKRERAAPSFF